MTGTCQRCLGRFPAFARTLGGHNETFHFVDEHRRTTSGGRSVRCEGSFREITPGSIRENEEAPR